MNIATQLSFEATYGSTEFIVTSYPKSIIRLFKLSLNRIFGKATKHETHQSDFTGAFLIHLQEGGAVLNGHVKQKVNEEHVIHGAIHF